MLPIAGQLQEDAFVNMAADGSLGSSSRTRAGPAGTGAHHDGWLPLKSLLAGTGGLQVGGHAHHRKGAAAPPASAACFMAPAASSATAAGFPGPALAGTVTSVPGPVPVVVGPQTPPANAAHDAAILYMECMKSFTAASGAIYCDGCREFVALGHSHDWEKTVCAACGCHRSFHRRVDPAAAAQSKEQLQSVSHGITPAITHHVDLSGVTEVSRQEPPPSSAAPHCATVTRTMLESMIHALDDELVNTACGVVESVKKITNKLRDILDKGTPQETEPAIIRDQVSLSTMTSRNSPTPFSILLPEGTNAPSSTLLEDINAPASTLHQVEGTNTCALILHQVEGISAPSCKVEVEGTLEGTNAPFSTLHRVEGTDAPPSTLHQVEGTHLSSRPPARRYSKEERTKLDNFGQSCGYSLAHVSKTDFQNACADIGLEPKRLREYIYNTRQKLRKKGELW